MKSVEKFGADAMQGFTTTYSCNVSSRLFIFSKYLVAEDYFQFVHSATLV